MCAGESSGGGVPEGSGEFRRVLVKVPEAGFRKVPESSGVCWCRFRRRGSGRFRRVPACAGEGSGGGVPEGSGEFRCVLV